MEFDHLDYAILIVEDLERSVQFYANVLELPLSHRAEHYAQFDTGVTRFGLYTRQALGKTLGFALEPPVANSPGFEIGFKVADVDAAFSELLRRGAVAKAPPADRPWGQRTAYLSDPDGYLIELAQDLG